MPISYQCECGDTLSFPDDRVGDEVACPKCERRFQVPGAIPGEGPNRARNVKAKRIGWISIGTLAAAVVILGVWLLASAMADPARDLRVVPADVTALGGVNFENARGSDWFEDLAAKVEDEPGYARLKAAGVGLESVQSLYFALDAVNLTQHGESSVMVLLRNREPLDLDALAAAIGEGQGVVVEKTALASGGGEVPAYALSHPRRRGQFALTLLNPRLLVAGSRDMVTRALNLSAAGGDSVAENARLMELAPRGTRPEALWMAVDMPKERMADLGARFSIGQARLEQIEGALLSLDAGEGGGILLGLALTCESEETAEAVQAVLQAVYPSVAGLILEAPPESFGVSRDAQRVALSVELPRETLDRLAEGGIAPPEIEPGAAPWRQGATATAPEHHDDASE